MDLFVEEKDALREQILPEPFGISRKGALVDPEDHKANVPEDKILGLGFAATLGLSD